MRPLPPSPVTQPAQRARLDPAPSNPRTPLQARGSRAGPSRGWGAGGGGRGGVAPPRWPGAAFGAESAGERRPAGTKRRRPG